MLFLLAFSGWLYWPGLTGGFVFDDFSNLILLNRIEVQDDFLAGVVSYLDSGWSGPTKRPVAMISFLLEYPSWPHDPAPFKRTNVLLHLVTSLLVGWLTLLLAQRSGMEARRRPWFALLTMALFALHPIQVSTTLYVIQRMTILAALFSVAALIAYIKGGRRLEAGDARGWWLLLLVYPALALVSILSKENGILTAFFAALIGFAFGAGPFGGRSVNLPRWQNLLYRLVTYGPALLLAGAMLVHFGYTMRHDPDLARREFTVVERLLTEPRVIWSYLYDIFIPKIQTAGLYHDNYRISHSLLSPWTTLPAIAGLLLLASVAALSLRKWPFPALAVLGYLAGHLLESTYIGLEIYFEHRNYLPVVFILLGIAWLLMRIGQSRKASGIALALVLTGGLAAIAQQRIQLWSDPLMLMLVWADQSGGSERALLDAANQLQIAGDVPTAITYVERAMASNPDNPRPVLYALIMQCRYQASLPGANIERARELLQTHVYHQATYNHVKQLRQMKEGGDCSGFDTDALRGLVRATFDDEAIRSGNIKALEHYEMGNLALLDGNPDEAVAAYRKAVALRADTQVGLVEVARLASAGYAAQALSHLQDVRRHNAGRTATASSDSARREYLWVASELDRLETILRRDLRREAGTGAAQTD